MIETAIPLTLSLATALGVYFIAAGLSGLADQDRWPAILRGFRDQPALTYIAGVFVFCLGVALILTHNIWTDLLAGFVSLIGWAAAIEGLLLVAVPMPLLDFAETFLEPGRIRAFAIGVIVFGAVVLFAGLTGTAG